MKFIQFAIISMTLFIIGCEQNDKKLILLDTWACPKNASLKTWKDGYLAEEHKFRAIGCKKRNGDRVGYHVAWKDYGIKEHEGEFVDDKPDGEWSYYHENGYLKSRGFFRLGKRVGVWDHWDKKGKYKYNKKYKDGGVIENKESLH